MSEVAFGSILSSKPYRFLVGPQKREFFIHASLAASQSPVIDSLVNGSMKEATSGCTVWEDVDEDTFVRFGQYVYTSNYEGCSAFVPVVPEPPEQESNAPSERAVQLVFPDEPPELDEPEAVEPVAGEPDDWIFDIRSTPSKKKQKKKACYSQRGDAPKEAELPAVVEERKAETLPQMMSDAWICFQIERCYECGVSGTHYAPSNKDSRKVYKDVFLSHARVHMMADYYNIQPLAQLALHKLHRILSGFTLHKERICDVVALLRYCYEEDERPLLRELVSAFAACHVKQLWTSMEFQDLVADHGELSRAIMGNIVERMQ